MDIPQVNLGAEKASIKSQYEGAVLAARRPGNIGENLDRQIAELEAKVESLHAVKSRLENAKLLGISLDDLRIAMQY